MADERTIVFEDDREAGRLRAVEEGLPVGFIAYFALAGRLVEAFYAIASAEGLSVVPLCPYAASWAAQHPDLAPAATAELVAAARAQLASDSGLW
ncbi:GNAT family N-acetyltransferase [Streptomyces sp. NPDC002602]|uniref:GNAT family N-acetyltransferase n=1 Tax=Streptomyces sp. NPDC002602 TaxID=3364654 RepID=UPI00369FCF59